MFFNRVNDLSRCIDMDLKPTVEELLDTFLNKEEVEKILRTPVILYTLNQTIYTSFRVLEGSKI